MADHGFTGGAPPQLTLDLRRHSPLLPGREHPELVIGRRIVAAIALVGEDALDGVADELLHFRNHVSHVKALPGNPYDGHTLAAELAALGVRERGCDRDLDA